MNTNINTVDSRVKERNICMVLGPGVLGGGGGV